MVENSNNYKTESQVEGHLNVDGPAGTATTDDNGEISLDLGDGYYWFIETDRPTSVTGAVAVPFGISLPLMNQVAVEKDGKTIPAGSQYMNTVHVYPKNTSKQPEMDKYFGEPEEGTDSDQLGEGHGLHPDYEEYLEKKEAINARVGSVVPYEVKTSLKAGQVYETLSWSDIMTTGLKYNKDVVLTYEYPEGTTVTVNFGNADSKTETDYGFDLVIRDDTTIANINKALEAGDVEFTLKYTATLTEDAVVDRPESNNISFTPVEPKHKNDYETKPTDGKITTDKTWAEGEAPANVLVTYILFEDGNPIGSVTLNGEGIQSESLPVGVSVEINGYNVTFSGLDNEKTYKIEEFADGYDPEYTSATGITNTKNPDTITPTPPQVETYGHRFQKVDQDGNGLAGAEFVVKDANGNYLVEKDNETKEFEQEAYAKAEKAYKDAVEANKSTEEQLAELKATRDKAYAAVNTQWEFTGATADEGFKFVAGVDGYFKVTGLKEGTYYLEETKAPEGFAKLTSDVKFQVAKGSMGETELEGTELTDAQGFRQIENKKVTIPETGGIGSIIFVIAGLMLMGLAAYKMKANKEEELR